MKRRKKIYLYMSVFLLAVYIGLVILLYFSEYSDDGATIRTFGDAIWYSLVTLTTVGYGDLTPVTPLGHAVGVVFLLLSAGMIMTLFGAALPRGIPVPAYDCAPDPGLQRQAGFQHCDRLPFGALLQSECLGGADASDRGDQPGLSGGGPV